MFDKGMTLLMLETYFLRLYFLLFAKRRKKRQQIHAGKNKQTATYTHS